MANGNGHRLELRELPPEVRALLTTIIDAALALAQLQKGNSNTGSNPVCATKSLFARFLSVPVALPLIDLPGNHRPQYEIQPNYEHQHGHQPNAPLEDSRNSTKPPPTYAVKPIS